MFGHITLLIPHPKLFLTWALRTTAEPALETPVWSANWTSWSFSLSVSALIRPTWWIKQIQQVCGENLTSDQSNSRKWSHLSESDCMLILLILFQLDSEVRFLGNRKKTTYVIYTNMWCVLVVWKKAKSILLHHHSTLDRSPRRFSCRCSSWDASLHPALFTLISKMKCVKE